MVDDIIAQRHFSEMLTYFREKKGLSKTQLSKEASISLSSISQYESGEKAPGIIAARHLAEALDVTVNDLCGTDTEEKWKENPVTALLTVLELFQFQIAEIGTNTITLGFKEDCSDYSASEVKKFFEKYKVIQAIENLDVGGKELKDDMMRDLITPLAQEFKHLPGWPPYKGSCA